MSGETRRLATNLTEGAVIPVMVRFCIPVILANLLHTTYNMVDTLVVGRLLGSGALSAVSIGSDVMLLINLASNGLCSGAQIVVGQHVGAKDTDAVNRCVGTLISIFMLLALAVTAVMIGVSTPLFRLLNTPETVWQETMAYALTCFAGLLPSFGYNVLGAIQRGMGDSKSPLLFVGVASVVNLILDLILVPNLGVFGAALATALAQTISFLWAMWFLYRRRDQLGFDFKPASFVPDRELAGQFFRIGLPICLQNTLMQCATLFINSFIFAYGVTASAVNGVGNKLGSLALIITNSLVRSGSAMVAQNIAAGKMDRVRKVYLFNTVCGAAFALILSVFSILFTEEIFGFFVDDRAVIEMADIFLPILVLRYFSFACRASNIALINGIGKPKLNFTIGVLDGLILRVGASLLLGMVLELGLVGYWYGLALGGFSPLMVGLPYFLSGKWKQETLITRRSGKT